jgi:hypothetical protein
VVDVEILAGNLVAREDLREARIDARHVPATRPMLAFGATAMRVAFLIPFFTFGAQEIPVEALVVLVLSTVSGRPRSLLEDLKGVDRHHALGPARALEVLVCAALASEVGALVDSHVGDELEDAVGEVVCMLES